MKARQLIQVGKGAFKGGLVGAAGGALLGVPITGLFGIACADSPTFDAWLDGTLFLGGVSTAAFATIGGIAGAIGGVKQEIDNIQIENTIENNQQVNL